MTSAISLHTRATCDACPAPATVEIDSGFFLCDACADSLEQFVLSQVASGLSAFPDAGAVAAAPARSAAAAVTNSSSCGGSFSLPEPCADVSSGRYDPLNWEVKGATSQSGPQDSTPNSVLTSLPQVASKTAADASASPPLYSVDLDHDAMSLMARTALPHDGDDNQYDRSNSKRDDKSKLYHFDFSSSSKGDVTAATFAPSPSGVAAVTTFHARIDAPCAASSQ